MPIVKRYCLFFSARHGRQNSQIMYTVSSAYESDVRTDFRMTSKEGKVHIKMLFQYIHRNINTRFIIK